MKVNAYLLFDGQCEEAFRFYEKTLHARVEQMLPFEDAPGMEPTPPGFEKKIMHARMSIGPTMLMGSDCPPGRYHKPQGFSVSINIETPEESERVFHALAEGGVVMMPIAQTFWTTRFGMLVDRFSIPWMINCDQAP